MYTGNVQCLSGVELTPAERAKQQTLDQYNRFMTITKQAATKENLAVAEDLYTKLHMYGRPAVYGPTLMSAIEKSMADYRTRVAAAPTAAALPTELSTVLKNWSDYILRTPKFENYEYLARLYNIMTVQYARYFSAADLKKYANQLATFYNALPKEIKTAATVTKGVVQAGGPAQITGKSAAEIFQDETVLINKMMDDFNAYLNSLPPTMNKYSAMSAIYNELKAKYAKHFTASALPEMAAKIANYYAALTAPAAAAAPDIKLSPTESLIIYVPPAPADVAVPSAVTPAAGYAYTAPALPTVQPMAVSEAPVEAAAAAASAQAEEGITVMGMKIPFKFIYLGGAAVAFWMFSQQMTRGGRR